MHGSKNVKKNFMQYVHGAQNNYVLSQTDIRWAEMFNVFHYIKAVFSQKHGKDICGKSFLITEHNK